VRKWSGTPTPGMKGVGGDATVAEARAWWRELPTSLEIPRRRARISVSLARFSSLRTMPAYKTKIQENHMDETCECTEAERANAILQ